MGVWDVLRTPVSELARGAMSWYASDPQPTTRPDLSETAPSYPTYSGGKRATSLESWDTGLTYQHQRDPVLRRKGFKNFELQGQDPQVRAVDSLVRYAAISKGFSIAPPPEFKDDPDAQYWAGFVAWVLAEMRGTVEDVSYKVLSAVGDGYSFSEKVYNRIKDGEYKGLIGLAAIKHKKPGCLDFQLDEFDNVTGLVSLASTASRAVLDPCKFIVYTWDGDYGNPYGRPVKVATFKPWQVKTAVRQFWAGFLDKFGMPPVMIKYPKGADKATITRAQEIAESITHDTTFTMPNDLEIDVMKILEGAGGSGNGSYEAAMRYCDAEIAKAYVGAALAVNENAKTGSRAQATTHADTNNIFFAKVATDLEESIWFEQVIRPLIEMNTAALPVERMPRLVLNPLEEKDQQARANLIQTLIEVGEVKPGEPWIREFVDVPAQQQPEPGEELPGEEADPGMTEDPMQEFPTDPGEVPSEDFAALPSLILAGDWLTPAPARQRTSKANGNGRNGHGRK